MIVVFFGARLIIIAIIAATWGNAFKETYTKKDLIENFKTRQQEIYSLRDYFNSIVPKNKEVDIEYASSTSLARLSVENLDPAAGTADISSRFQAWDLDIDGREVDSICKSLHWTLETLIAVKQKLDAAHCISVRNGTPCQVGFQRSGMGMYFYDLFPTPMSDSLRSRYNDSCTHIAYNSTVVLEYGGGAVGPQCFSKQ